MRTILASIIIALTILASCESNKNPIETDPILDSANILTELQEDSLSFFILELRNETGPQIAIVMIDTLRGEKIEAYSLRIAEQIKLGRERFDDGILITVAVKNHQVRIEVGRGLEKIIRDEVANKIIIFDMAPKFRSKDYFGGLRIAVMKMKTLIEHKKKLIGY